MFERISGKPISPWDWCCKVQSPSGNHIAKIEDAHEVAMGAPTRGTLYIDSLPSIDDCSPSIVWSECSKYLAAPQWQRNRSQKLIVIEVSTGKIQTFSNVYAVLELHSFSNGIVRGVDSPIHNPQEFEIQVINGTA